METKDGLHIWKDHFYPEAVDPITGEVLPEGAVKDGIGVSVAVEIVEPESLERSVGRIRRIVDQRPKES